MHPIIAKSFGGLTTQYYFRQLFFGLTFPVLTFFMISQANHPIQIGLIVLAVINTLLYPYSRYVYESVLNFFIGENVFYVNAFFMLSFKILTMIICWGMAIFIAPIGLVYLYFHHSKANG